MDAGLKSACRFLLLALIPTVALSIWHGNITAIEIKDLLVQLSCMVLLCMAGVRLLFLEKIRFPKDPLLGLVALYGILILACYLLSNRASIHSRALIPQVYGILIFLLTVRLFDMKHAGTIASVCTFSGSAAAVYGIVQYLELDPLEWLIPTYDARGLMVSFFGHKNYFALFLILTIPMGAAHAVMSKPFILRIAAAGSTALMMTALGLSRSRGGFIAFFLSAVVTSALFFGKRFVTGPLKWKAALPLVLIPLAIGSSIMVLPETIRRDFSGLAQMAGVRMEYYRSGMEVIARRPLLGTGPGSFVTEYPLNKTYKTLTHDPNKVLNHIHNDLLETWVEYGAAGVLLYAGILTLFLMRWARCFKAAEDTRQQVFLLAVAASLIGYLIYSPFTVAGRYMSSTFFFWLTLGTGYLITAGGKNDGRQFTFQNPFSRRLGLSIALSLLLVLASSAGIWLILQSYRSDIYIKRASEHSSNGRYKQSLLYLDKAVSLRPNSVEAFYQRGYVLFQLDRVDETLSDYKRVDRLAPNYINVTFNMASCWYRKRDWPEAIRLAALSHRLFPDYEPPLLMLANCYYYLRQPVKALEYCDLLIQKNPSDHQGWQIKEKGERLKQRLEEILKPR